MDGIVAHESIFTDYVSDDDTKKLTVASFLTKPDSVVWEVWRTEHSLPVDVVGILYLTRVRWGQEAVAHYVFFDGDLRGKTSIINEIIGWCFEDHPERNWKALNRLTVEIPDVWYALAKHAHFKLGFGGKFRHRIGNRTLEVEGIKRGAVLWRGEMRDVLILGLINDEWRNKTGRRSD